MNVLTLPTRIVITLVAISFTVACGSRGIDSSKPTTPNTETFAGNGTITSGGGNGLDGKMTEMYRVSIELLPEYKRYVFPILRRLSAGRPDIFMAYLQWSVRNKIWYFVPRKLQSLPQERIALAFKSIDQLALHSEKEIFIDQPAYIAMKSDQERAYLLLHEIVMGAKLLMKQPPARQCALLSTVASPDACKDKLTMDLAIASSDTTSVEGTKISALELGGRDHESVRAMTVNLFNREQNFDRASIAALRARLDFNFPWDHLLSNLDMRALLAAIERSALSNANFKAETSYYSDTATACHIESMYNNQLFIGFGAKADPAALYGQTSFRFSFYYNQDQNLFSDIRGVLDPRGGTDIVDMIEIESKTIRDARTIMLSKYANFRLRIFIDRGPLPKIIEYRVSPVAVRTIKQDNGFQVGEYELIDIQNTVPMRCRAQ